MRPYVLFRVGEREDRGTLSPSPSSSPIEPCKDILEFRVFAASSIIAPLGYRQQTWPLVQVDLRCRTFAAFTSWQVSVLPTTCKAVGYIFIKLCQATLSLCADLMNQAALGSVAILLISQSPWYSRILCRMWQARGPQYFFHVCA